MIININSYHVHWSIFMPAQVQYILPQSMFWLYNEVRRTEMHKSQESRVESSDHKVLFFLACFPYGSGQLSRLSCGYSLTSAEGEHLINLFLENLQIFLQSSQILSDSVWEYRTRLVYPPAIDINFLVYSSVRTISMLQFWKSVLFFKIAAAWGDASKWKKCH